MQHQALLTRQMKQAQLSFIRLGASFLGTGLRGSACDSRLRLLGSGVAGNCPKLSDCDRGLGLLPLGSRTPLPETRRSAACCGLAEI